MRLGQDVLSNLEAATAREWMLATSLGDAASGTAAGAHTRRSHALLLASDPHGLASIVLLKVDERLQIGNETFELACNLVEGARFNGASTEAPSFIARPSGHQLLLEFHADPWPTWRWQAGPATIEKSLTLIEGHHAVAIVYRHIDGPPARISVSPLMAHRRPDQLQGESDAWRGVAQAVPGRVRIETTAGGPVLSLWHGGAFMPARVWQRGLAYPADREQAAPPARKHPSPGRFVEPPAGAFYFPPSISIN